MNPDKAREKQQALEREERLRIRNQVREQLERTKRKADEARLARDAAEQHRATGRPYSRSCSPPRSQGRPGGQPEASASTSTASNFKSDVHSTNQGPVAATMAVVSTGTTILGKKATPAPFYGAEQDDYDRHLKQFKAACTINAEDTDKEMLTLFPFTLRADAMERFYGSGKTFGTFGELEKEFTRYYKRKYERRDPITRL